MDFNSFWDIFDGATNFFSNGGEFIKSFYLCIPEHVRTYLFAVFVLIFGACTLLLLFRILK